MHDLRQSRKAGFVQDRLQVLDRLSVESSDLLNVLGQTLHQLTALTAPIHSRATALTNAQQNIAAAKQAVDQLLEHLETSRRVSAARPLQMIRCPEYAGSELCVLHTAQCS